MYKKSHSITWFICLILIYSKSAYSQTDTYHTVRELNNRGKALFKQGMYHEAETIFVTAFESYKQSPQQQKIAHVETLNGLAKINIKKGLYNKADSLLNIAFELQNETSEKTSLEYAETLNTCAWLNMERQEYTGTGIEDLLINAIDIRKKNSGEMDVDYAESIRNLGYYYLFAGPLDQAETFLNKAVEICSKTAGETSLAYANAMMASGSFHMRKSEFEQAASKYKLAIEIMQNHLGENHPDYAEALLTNSISDSYTGKYEDVERTVFKVLSIIENYYDRKHIHYAVALSTLGGLYYLTGDYQKAETFILESLQLTGEVMGEKHSYYFNALNSLAAIYLKNGANEKAEQYLIKSLELRKELYGEQNPSLINATANLGYYYLELSNYEPAEKLLHSALHLTESTLGVNSVEYASISEHLGRLYMDKSDFTPSLYYLEKATSILKTILGESHQYYLSTLENSMLAIMLANKVLPDSIPLKDVVYDHKPVEQLLTEIYEKRKSIWGETHPENVYSLGHLAYYYYLTGNQEKATGLYENTLRLIDEQHSCYLPVISNLGIFAHQSGDINPALTYYTKVFQVIKKQIEQKLLFLSEKELSLFWSTLDYHSVFHNTFFFQYHDTIPAYSDFMYDYELFSKALLLNSARRTRQSIIDNGGRNLLDLLKSYEETVMKTENDLMKTFGLHTVTELYDFLLNSDDTKLKQLSENLNGHKEYINREEKKLALEFKEYNLFKTDFSLDRQDIQKALDKNEVAIEFLNFTYIDIKTLNIRDTLYGALLLSADAPSPRMIPLCNAKELQEAIRHDHNAIYSIIWKPIEEHLNGATHVYIAPAGLLHTVSFAGIKKGNRYLCEDYTIHNLLSTKDVIRLKQPATKSPAANHAALFGGADYGYSLHELDSLHSAQTASYPTNLTRSMLDYMDSTRGQGFNYLSGSKTEVQLIEKRLSDNRWKTMLFTDINASETRFKSLSAKADSFSPRLIHISTHGFFMPLHKNDRFKENQLLSSDTRQNIFRLSNNPLMRTGLVFSGANHVWNGGDPVNGVDDGILTAYEISNMNLSHTELVVLSACNTGLGDINGSEGVFGLQRAFRLAGVETMIVCLWEAPDKETVELMTAFYSLWTQGLDKKTAFSHAQLKMRQTYPDQPEKWAGFIMIE